MAEGKVTARDRSGVATGSVSVLLPLPLPTAYDYGVGGLDLAPGDFVAVPLGSREVVGVVWGDGRGDVAADKLRDVVQRLDVPPLPDPVRRFVDWVASYTLSPPGSVVRMAMSVRQALQPPPPLTAYAACSPLPKFRATPERARVLDVLRDGPPRESSELIREAGVSPSVVHGLVAAGVLRALELPRWRRAMTPEWRPAEIPLTAGQQAAADELCDRVTAKKFSVSVLDGVTGAGKTEVYFAAVAAALAVGRQALVLLPEIALTPQWLQRFGTRFGAAPTVWHSELRQTQRRDNWHAVAAGAARVVVGARSALFLPFSELGLIVVDEEHDTAFKQADGVAYHARDMAVVRAQISDAAAILVSATPSLETLANVERGKYAVVQLPERHAAASMPVIELVDLRQTPPPRQRFLSPPLRQAMIGTHAAGEQMLLFLNRRGYAPLTLCRRCGHRFDCPNCTAWLVEHRFRRSLQCHHCGHAMPLPSDCPKCGEPDSLVACGPGVERIAEEVAEIVPAARVVVVTSDTVSGPEAAAELIRLIIDHEVDILIGTQMIAKGHHFPMLTLVGVVDADLGLGGGDLRAAERTHQLLQQVAGRAGRADLSGRVLVQSHAPEHRVMQALASGDRARFLEVELALRRAGGWPPYGRLAALVVSGVDAGVVDRVAAELGRSAPTRDDVRVLGPAPAPLAILRGRHRRRLLVKATLSAPLQAYLRAWTGELKLPTNVRLAIDIDPYSFL